MRILNSIRSVNPAGGGPIEGIKQVAAVHAAAGHQTEIVSLDAPNDEWVKACPVLVHAMGPVRSGYGYTARLVPWLAENRTRFDAVIVSGLWQYSALGVWRALRRTATPYFVFPHGMLDPWFKRQYPFKHLKKWLYWPWADYRVLRDARAVVFTCEEERLLARQSFWLYRCHERVVGYGTSAPAGQPQRQKAAFLARFPELEGKRLLLFLGRLHEKKGCDLLIRAFANIHRGFSTLPSELPPVHLVIAGPCADPAYLSYLRDLTAKEFSKIQPAFVHLPITFASMLSGEEKWGAFRAAEAFVLPSHQENFGIAVAEALACGLPVLISNKVNIWREVEADGAGFVEDDTAEGTTKLLRDWIGLDEEARGRMSLAARRCFDARFEVERAAESLLSVLRESIGP